MCHITVQRAVSDTATKASTPAVVQLKRWAKVALKQKLQTAELTIRIVDKDEITALNTTYRHKNKATNVLSFPFITPDGVELETPLLGDIIICAAVIAEEAEVQQKTLSAHWAHMVVHGILHLLGFDHENDADAIVMEAEEIRILNILGFTNPYQE